MSQVQEEVSSPPRFWVRLILFLLCAVASLICLNIALSALNTLHQLDVIEAERDNWQRPSQVIQALGLKNGNSVLDVGCGSGYFSLRLSDPVGASGKVIAEDIRRLPLPFLWARAVRKGKHNISVHLGTVDDPRVPLNSVDAVLISNTYHEFTDPLSILGHVRQALRSGGRLVIIDRSPRPNAGQAGTREHEVSFEQVEKDLHRGGFAVDARTEHFIEKDPDNESWWIIVAHHP
jgi:ubiquinone/menaquinone biosynthesis C-methylase UbiE